jgi:NAD kinase
MSPSTPASQLGTHSRSLPPERATLPSRIAFLASPIWEAQQAMQRLSARYGNVPPESAEVIVALGGDGFMLQTLHRFMRSGQPIYGMHRGTVGFLMNEFSEDKLIERIAAARVAVIHPLLMCARTRDDKTHEFHAFNAKNIRPRDCAFSSMGRSGLQSWSPTVCWWPPRRDPLHIIFQLRARLFRSMHRSSR